MLKQTKTVDIQGVLYDITISRNRSHDLKYRQDKRTDFGLNEGWGDKMVRIEPVEDEVKFGIVLRGMLYHSNMEPFEEPTTVYHKIYNYIQSREFNLNNL